MAVDSSYRSRVYRERGGARLVAATGGSIAIDGGSLLIATGTAGGTLTIAPGGNMSVAALATVAVSGNMNIAAGGQLSMATGSKRIYSLRTATQSLTMTAAESGATVINTTLGNIMTLPAVGTVGAGIFYKFVIGTAALATGGVAAIKIRPNAVDTIVGGVAAATDSENLVLDGAADVEGDFVEMISDGSIGWYVTKIQGTWSRAAAT